MALDVESLEVLGAQVDMEDVDVADSLDVADSVLDEVDALAVISTR